MDYCQIHEKLSSILFYLFVIKIKLIKFHPTGVESVVLGCFKICYVRLGWVRLDWVSLDYIKLKKVGLGLVVRLC